MYKRVYGARELCAVDPTLLGNSAQVERLAVGDPVRAFQRVCIKPRVLPGAFREERQRAQRYYGLGMRAATRMSRRLSLCAIMRHSVVSLSGRSLSRRNINRGSAMSEADISSIAAMR